jgi:hypothetical protein
LVAICQLSSSISRSAVLVLVLLAATFLKLLSILMHTASWQQQELILSQSFRLVCVLCNFIHGGFSVSIVAAQLASSVTYYCRMRVKFQSVIVISNGSSYCVRIHLWLYSSVLLFPRPQKFAQVLTLIALYSTGHRIGEEWLTWQKFSCHHSTLLFY